MKSVGKYVGYSAIALIIILVIYSLGNSNNTTTSGFGSPSYDEIVDSSEYQDLEGELQDAQDCIDTLNNQLDNISSIASYAQDSEYEDMNDTLMEIGSSASDPECSN